MPKGSNAGATSSRDLQKKFLSQTSKHGKHLGANLDDLNDPYSHSAAFDAPLDASETINVDPKRLKVNIDDLLLDEKVYGAAKTSRKEMGAVKEQDDDSDEDDDDEEIEDDLDEDQDSSEKEEQDDSSEQEDDKDMKYESEEESSSEDEGLKAQQKLLTKEEILDEENMDKIIENLKTQEQDRTMEKSRGQSDAKKAKSVKM